jgi:hypothetical protein
VGTGTPATSDLNAVATATKGFWNTTPPLSTNPVGYYISSSVARDVNACLIDMYNLNLTDPHHYYGSPVYTLPFTLFATEGTPKPLPNEVAATLSYHSAYGSDPEHAGGTRPRASDRGRAYIGPLEWLAANNVVSAGMAKPVLDFTFIQTCLASYKRTMATAPPPNWLPAVWSRKEQVFKQVTHYAMDNSFDTIRKRGDTPGLKTWTALLP